MIAPRTTDESETALTVETVARTLESATAIEIVAWALREYRPRIALACSFGGPSGLVTLDLAMRIDPATPVYYLDTGLLFEETHETVGRIAERYGITPIRVQPRSSVAEQGERVGERLWERDPDACCALRKVEPQRAFLGRYDAWISGIRRDQSQTRSTAPVVQWDRQFGLVKVNPLAAWDEQKVWKYVHDRNLPYNPLHDRGYPSVGCRPCTRAVLPGGELRDGRWPGFAKTECGLHA